MPDFGDKAESVHLCSFPEDSQLWLEPEFMKKVGRLLEIREQVQKELEKAREARLIGNSLEARLNFQAPEDDFDLLEEFRSDLPALFIVSEVEVRPAESRELAVQVSRAGGQKCERCWNYSVSVGGDQDYPAVCERCARVLRDEIKRKP